MCWANKEFEFEVKKEKFKRFQKPFIDKFRCLHTPDTKTGTCQIQLLHVALNNVILCHHFHFSPGVAHFSGVRFQVLPAEVFESSPMPWGLRSMPGCWYCWVAFSACYCILFISIFSLYISSSAADWLVLCWPVHSEDELMKVRCLCCSAGFRSVNLKMNLTRVCASLLVNHTTRSPLFQVVSILDTLIFRT
jgi:hypothetical protein